MRRSLNKQFASFTLLGMLTGWLLFTTSNPAIECARADSEVRPASDPFKLLGDQYSTLRAQYEGLTYPALRERLGPQPSFREKLASLEIDIMALQHTELRSLSAMSAGQAPGPEVSLQKVKGTEIQQRITELMLEAIGYYANPYSQEWLQAGWNEPPIGPEYAAPIAPRYFNVRKTSIYGGSNEIQRNIIAKMVLGL